jgi:hypothetical protein
MGMGIPRRRDAALTVPLSGCVCRRDEAQGVHQLSGGLKPGEVPAFGHQGHSPRALDATAGLEGVDRGGEPPGVHLICELLFQTLEPCGVFGDRSDVLLEDQLRGRVGQTASRSQRR